MFEIFEGVLNKYNGNEKEAVIPLEVTSIGEFAFYSCLAIEKVVLHDKVNSIGQFAFYGCENLKEINLPESIELIGAGAFSCCYSIEEMKLPQNVRTLNKSTFYRCRSLKHIILPDTIYHIDRSAFGFCKALESIQLPAFLKSIGNTAFENCTSLKKIELPQYVKSLGDKVFLNCENLREIKLSEQLNQAGLATFQTYGKISIIANNHFMLTPKMFDEHYMFDVVSKNVGNYQFINSYLPCVNFDVFKPVAKVMLLVNFLETYDKHENKEMYLSHLNTMKIAVTEYLVKEKRYIPLNKALELELFTSNDLEPYFEKITDREEKAKIMEYKNKETNTSSGFDDLEDLLDDLF